MTAPASIKFSRTTGHGAKFKKVEEVEIKYYDIADETDGLQPGDVFLRVDPKSDDAYPIRTYVVRREVPVTEEEAALIQAGINYGHSEARL